MLTICLLLVSMVVGLVTLRSVFHEENDNS